MIACTIQEIQEMIGGELQVNQCSLETKVLGVSIDSRKIALQNIFFAINGDKVDGHIFLDDVYDRGATLAIIDNKDYQHRAIATLLVEDVVKALQTLAKVYRASLKAKVIGITGSNGKTSCKDIVSAMLSAKYEVVKTLGNQNNEIGVPLTLLRMAKTTDVAVLEMGMENLGDIHFLNELVKQDMGIVTNVGVAHLENLKTIENIGRAKLELLDGIVEDGLFVYYGDDAILQAVMQEKQTAKVKVETFGMTTNNTMYLTHFSQEYDRICFQTNRTDTIFSMKTLGKHQALNAMPAILCAYALGLQDEDIQAGLDTYVSTGMRNEIIKKEQMIILNDTYKSNPQSAEAAIDTFACIEAPYKIIVLADMLDLGSDEKAYHYALGEYVAQNDFDMLIGYGALAESIVEGARHIQPNKQYQLASSHEAIYTYLKPYCNQTCAVLLKGSRGMELDKVVDLLIGDCV